MGCGLAVSNLNSDATIMPGWSANGGSWGWMANGNKCSNGDAVGTPYGVMWSDGDVIGCGLNYRTGDIFWTINGLALPTAFARVIQPNGTYDINDKSLARLFAVVGLQDIGQHVRFNWGKEKFVYRDIDPFYIPTKTKKQVKKKRDPADQPGCLSVVLTPFAAFVGFMLAIILLSLKALFDISLLHTSLGSFVPVITLEEIQASIERVFDMVSLPFLNSAWTAFVGLFGYLDFLSALGVNWNCGGVLSLFAPVIIVAILIIMLAILQQDILLRWAISSQKTEKDGCCAYYGYKALTVIGAAALLAVLQVVLVAVTSLIGSVWGIQRSCSALDAQFVNVGKTLCAAFVIFFFYSAVLLFAGSPEFNFRGLTVGWIKGGIELAFITVGIWTPSTVESFKVLRRAADFDNDDDDDDNQQQTVMTLLGRSRGLIWLPIPIGVVMTKVAEALNDPPYLISSYNESKVCCLLLFVTALDCEY